MLSFQRDALPAGIDSPSSGDSSAGSDFEASNSRADKKIEKFLNNLNGFVVENDLDRKLLLGLVKRDYPIKKKGSSNKGDISFDIDQDIKGGMQVRAPGPLPHDYYQQTNLNADNSQFMTHVSHDFLDRSETGTPQQLVY